MAAAGRPGDQAGQHAVQGRRRPGAADERDDAGLPDLGPSDSDGPDVARAQPQPGRAGLQPRQDHRRRRLAVRRPPRASTCSGVARRDARPARSRSARSCSSPGPAGHDRRRHARLDRRHERERDGRPAGARVRRLRRCPDTTSGTSLRQDGQDDEVPTTTNGTTTDDDPEHDHARPRPAPTGHGDTGQELQAQEGRQQAGSRSRRCSRCSRPRPQQLKR